MAAASQARSASLTFLTFRLDSRLYALPADRLLEVIRVPPVARVPQGPPALWGIANLRGVVLPVAGLREMLGMVPMTDRSAARAIVVQAGAKAAVVVDSVEGLVTLRSDQIETRPAELASEGGEILLGAFSLEPANQVAKIVDVEALLHRAFTRLTRAKREARTTTSARLDGAVVAAKNIDMLVTFDVAGQEFALPLEVVHEILPAPSAITAVAQADEVVLGISSVRGVLLPLLSLRALLGFAGREAGAGREKVLVMNVGGSPVGLIADAARAVVAADRDLMDPMPPVLAARTGGESRVRSVFRGEGGRRLISVLSPDGLFREDVMQRLRENHRETPVRASEAALKANDEVIFLIFRLGDDEYGIPIDAVVEVAQVPSKITRVPKTPKFLEGVVNVRGEVLPVVDQRRRFDMPPLEHSEGRRLLVIRTERHRAGLIVDSVSEVLRTQSARISPPPQLTDETSRLVHGVVDFVGSERMVLILDPTELLTRAERGLLDAFQASRNKADA